MISQIKPSVMPEFAYSELSSDEASSSEKVTVVSGDEVQENDFLWMRSMAANRGFQCPVFYEPYLQNWKDSYARM